MSDFETLLCDASQLPLDARIDTVPKLAAATRLYESLGFVRRDAYYETPVGETIFMEMKL